MYTRGVARLVKLESDQVSSTLFGSNGLTILSLSSVKIDDVKLALCKQQLYDEIKVCFVYQKISISTHSAISQHIPVSGCTMHIVCLCVILCKCPHNL